MPYNRTDDPLADFDRWDREQQRELERLPVCCECDKPIQDEIYYEFDGEYICPECLENNHEKRSGCFW
jgi:hypothetical protein